MNRTIKQKIAEQLGHLYDADGAMAWLQTPQKLFGGRVPAAMIAAGDGKEVLTRLQFVNDGGYL